MMGYTHAAAGALAGATLGHFFGAPVFGAAIGALSSLLPDIDHPGSIVGSRARAVSTVIEMAAGHRKITHTVWFCIVLGLIAGWIGQMVSVLASNLIVQTAKMPLIAGDLTRFFITLAHSSLTAPAWLWACLALVGGVSHLVLDGMTRSGLEPFMPVSPFSIRGPVRTGSLIEFPLAVACLIVSWHFLVT